MPESDELTKDVREIKWHQEEIDSSLELLLRVNKPELLKQVLDMFGKAETRARIYLSVDGKKNISEIATDVRILYNNVYPILNTLRDWSLVTAIGEKDKQLVFKKTKLERILALSKELRKKFNVE